MAFVTARLAHLPREAFAAPIDFSKYPTLIVVCAIACISATAGVVEEAGFRGFLNIANPATTWLDDRHSDQRDHVFPRSSPESRLRNVRFPPILPGDQRSARLAGEI